MSKVIVFENNKGNVSVVTPTEQGLQVLTIEQIAQKDTPAGVPHYIVDFSTLPKDTGFFNAWVFTTPPSIEVNLNQAKVIYKEAADTRASNLSKPLVDEYMRLTAIGADTTAVQAQIQAINAAAEETAYLNANTVNELIACWPPELGPNPFLPVAAE